MRPKFRAWYVLAEEMINEILMISFVRKEIIGKFSDGSTSVPLKFEDKRNGEDVVLMQSTGLFDINGRGWRRCLRCDGDKAEKTGGRRAGLFHQVKVSPHL